MTYRIHVTKDKDAWLASVEGLEGGHTFARTLTKLDSNVREVIALIEDLPDGAEGNLELEWNMNDVPEEVREACHYQ